MVHMIFYKSVKGMNSVNQMYPCPYYVNALGHCPCKVYNTSQMHPCPCCFYPQAYNSDSQGGFSNGARYNNLIKLKDYGPEPFVINIDKAAKQNKNFRTALWTGKHLQVTLMSINVGEDIGLEIHPRLDQFIRIEEGEGLVKMGARKDRLDFEERVYDDFAFLIPAGTWHNLINTGNKPIKLYSIYAPPQHPRGTVHKTKSEAEAAE